MKRKRSDDIGDPTPKLRTVVYQRGEERALKRLRTLQRGQDAWERIPTEIKTRIFSHFNVDSLNALEHEFDIPIDCRYWTKPQLVVVTEIENNIYILHKCWDKVIIEVDWTDDDLNELIYLMDQYPEMKSIVHLNLLGAQDTPDTIQELISRGHFRSLRSLGINADLERSKALPLGILHSLVEVAKIQTLAVTILASQMTHFANIPMAHVTELRIDIRGRATSSQVESLLISTFPNLKKLTLSVKLADALVIRNRNLISLRISGTKIDKINVSNLPNLEDLTLVGLGSVDVTNNSRLKKITFLNHVEPGSELNIILRK